MNIILSPIHETFFSGRIWMGLDIEKIKFNIESNTNHVVSIIDFSKLAIDYNLIPRNGLLFFTVSYNENYNQFIKDVIFDISVARPDILLLPNLDQLYSFENKGYQELYKRRIDILDLEGCYYGDFEDYLKDDTRISPPFVFKHLRGSMSSGIRLIDSEAEFRTLSAKNKKRRFRENIRLYKKKKTRYKDQNLNPISKYSLLNFDKFFSKRIPFIIQYFIDNIAIDYKVLIFGDKYYVLKRKTRKNDFKASGSGIYEWIEPSTRILSYSKEIFDKMKVPFLSLDIIEKNEKYYLLEYQGIGFGPLTLIGSGYYFRIIDKKWKKVAANSNLEIEYANSIVFYLERMKNENH
jgi:hypothetical protein